jgi:polyisoprenoid-binding protein YceI
MESPEVMTKTKWVIDPAHSEIGFRVKHLMFANVRGSFKEFNASIYTSGDDFKTAEIDMRINPASVYTGIEQRDNHLRSADFFDAGQFREIIFTSSMLFPADMEDHFTLSGELTMKGIKKQIKLNVEFGAIIKDPWGEEKALFSINGRINRKDWGLNYNTTLKTGGVLISEAVWIQCEVQLIKRYNKKNLADALR